jgi:DNA-binding transcriptional LysR family regulator
MRWNDRIGRRIKLSDLHILLAVAQSGSMAKAANELAVSHPVVSRSISELERTLGVRLLERSRHGIELTECGRAILSRSHAAFDELRGVSRTSNSSTTRPQAKYGSAALHRTSRALSRPSSTGSTSTIRA